MEIENGGAVAFVQMSDSFHGWSFQYCPKYFRQLFTIHGVKYGYSVPLISCLLSSKEEKHYTELFCSLQKIFPERNGTNSDVNHLRPTQVLLDFERGLQNAVKGSLAQCHTLWMLVSFLPELLSSLFGNSTTTHLC